MKILYYDCFAGISGDMNLGAMIDLGIETDYLKKELEKLPVHGYELKVRKEIRKGITGTRVEVVVDEPHRHLFIQNPHHERDHGHGHHHHNHDSFAEIQQLILSSSLDDKVKKLSIDIFEKIAQAESKVHNKPLPEVHFHEVGALDSIVDIVGASICFYKLGADRVQCSTIELGGGTVHCAHGIYPVPAPATAEIVKNMPVRKGTVDYECTTPTGAAILAACVNEFSDKTNLKILKTGYGIGSKDSGIPNVLRIFLCESVTPEEETIQSFIIECNMDDMNPEFYDYIIDELLSAGAKDVYITPIIMKKSRPAVKLSVLCTTEDESRINEILFRETSTLGVRKYQVAKTILDRKIENIMTRFGEIRVKSAYYGGECIKSKPEYEDCIKIARAKGIPVNQVYREVEQVLGRKDGTI